MVHECESENMNLFIL